MYNVAPCWCQRVSNVRVSPQLLEDIEAAVPPRKEVPPDPAAVAKGAQLLKDVWDTVRPGPGR